jgi:hypothetical protein
VPLLASLLLLQQPAADSARLRHANGIPPAITAVRVTRAPVLDGRLDDSVWALATPITDLRQSDPVEGHLVSEATEVRVLYDATALYIGVRLFDKEPAKIAKHLGRRDTFTQSDDFRVLIDSYHDHRTAFRFDVTPLGVKGDLQFGDDGNFADQSWDPVWEVATSVDAQGWSAEYRIPFSQLRFSRAADQIWGIRFVRTILRKNEFAMWPFVGKTESGFVSKFGHLLGLHDIPAPQRLELLPYSVARGTFQTPQNPSDPYDRAHDYFGSGGMDLKYGVTSNLTLDATLNPDFGQVELDPAFVNLTAFEQFLPEHRPFFVEGADIFGFGGGTGGFLQFGNAPQFFYSRRVGHAPQGPITSGGQFVDYPSSTAILGAAKLTGRSPNGWTVGVLDAVTARERATVLDTTTGFHAHDDVEPTSNYTVARVKRTLNGGNDSYGMIATAVHRAINTPGLDLLRNDAYDFGVDLRHRWAHNTYAIAADFGGSYITGDRAAIDSAQRASSRYYQRPDNYHYDSTRTSLGGITGDVYFDKLAGAWLWGAATSFTSPGFEVNDLGFQHRGDRIANGIYLARHFTKPGPFVREATVLLQGAPSFNWEGDWIQKEVFLNSFGSLHNFWFFSLFAGYAAPAVDDRLTRGGPAALTPAGVNTNLFMQTNQRNAVNLGLGGGYDHDASGGWLVNLNPQLSWRVSSALSLSLAPNYVTALTSAQFVQRVSDTIAPPSTYGTRYVFASLRQHELDVTLRVNATMSRTLSLELFAQPFTFSGAYTGFKELAAPRTFDFNVYGQSNGSTISYDSASAAYTVKPSGAAPADSFAIYNPDFRTRSVRVNAVLRWEYRPGSTLFLVWTQSRSGFFADPSFDAGRDFGRQLFRDPPTNVLLVKVNYWLNL